MFNIGDLFKTSENVFLLVNVEREGYKFFVPTFTNSIKHKYILYTKDQFASLINKNIIIQVPKTKINIKL